LIFVKTETRSFYEAAVERTVARIAETLDLGALAREAALSSFHFHRAFRGMIGETPRENARCAPAAFHLAARSGVHFGVTASPREIHFIKGDAIMKAAVEHMPELRVATVAHVGPYNRISEAFERLGAIVNAAGILQPDTIMLAIYHDDPETTPTDQLRSEAGVTVPEGARLPEGITEARLAAGRYARTTHLGPYATLGDTWARFMGEWLPRSGERVAAGASYEVYRNNPSNAPPAELRTELYLPIA
jgi:AraC family transcriptional regulator